MTETITIKIDQEGNAQLETRGFKGKNCTIATDKLLAEVGKMGIGTNTKGIKYGPEYYQQTGVQVRT